MENGIKPQRQRHDILGVLIIILIAAILSTIIIINFTDATQFDNIDFGVQINITSLPSSDCPHAMLINPINNSILNTRNPTLTLYIYDDDESIWELITTFMDYSTNNTISTLTTDTHRNVSTVWTNRTPGETYKWYGYLDNGTGNHTTGTFYFTISQDIMGTASDFYGTWILLAILIILFILAIVFQSIILGVASMITSLIVTVTYANTIMTTGAVFDDTMLYIFIFITMAAFLDIVYLVFSKQRRY